jgi:hypothetical protein
MSEDEDAREQEYLEAEAAEQEAAKREAFEVRFPREVFLGVAKVLKIRDPMVFTRLVRLLRDDFYGFSLNCQNWPSRDVEIERLLKLRDAASLLASPGAWMSSINVLGRDLEFLEPLEEVEEEQLLAILKRLATHWDERLARLEARPSPRGRRSHYAFHELIVDLIRTYQQITKKRAKIPSTRFGKPGYYGDFYQFAIAAWHCLWDRVPEARHLMPSRDSALGEALRDHWPKKGTGARKLIDSQAARRGVN